MSVDCRLKHNKAPKMGEKKKKGRYIMKKISAMHNLGFLIFMSSE